MRAALTSIGMILMCTSGCNSSATSSPSAANPVVQESTSERDLKTEVFDDAIVSGQILYDQERMIITKGVDGAERIGVFFESGSRMR